MSGCAFTASAKLDPRSMAVRMSAIRTRMTSDAVSSPTISSASSTEMPASRNDATWRENAMMTSDLTGRPNERGVRSAASQRAARTRAFVGDVDR